MRNRYRPYPVGQFALAYLVALFANVVVLAVAPILVLVSYPATGVYFSRFIGKRVEWWEMRASVELISEAKRKLIVAWPFVVPGFVLHLFVVKHL